MCPVNEERCGSAEIDLEGPGTATECSINDDQPDDDKTFATCKIKLTEDDERFDPPREGAIDAKIKVDDCTVGGLIKCKHEGKLYYIEGDGDGDGVVISTRHIIALDNMVAGQSCTYKVKTDCNYPLFGADFTRDGDSKFKFNMTYLEYETSQIKTVTSRDDLGFSSDDKDSFLGSFPLENTVFRHYY